MSRPTSPTSYTVASPPSIVGGEGVYLQAQLQAIAASIASLRLLTPQVANTAPKVVIDGMQRLARAPWWPVSGQTADAWVFYNAPTSTWLYL